MSSVKVIKALEISLLFLMKQIFEFIFQLRIVSFPKYVFLGLIIGLFWYEDNFSNGTRLKDFSPKHAKRLYVLDEKVRLIKANRNLKN